MSRDELISHFCETPIWGGKGFAKGPRFLNMVIRFTFTPLSHYNSITDPRAPFLISLMEDLSIDFPFHLITSIIDVYQDTATCDKLIFPSAITQILQHFHIPIPLSPLFTIMGAISVDSVWQSEAQLQPKRPQVETTDSEALAAPPSSAPFSSTPSSSAAGGVTLNAIIEQLQRMQADFGGRLDYLTNEMCQMNNQVSRIARRQARVAGLAPSPFPSPEASADDVDDDEDDASSSSDDEMTTSQ